MEYNNTMRRRRSKQIVFVVIGLLLPVITIGFVNVASHSGKHAVLIEIAPSVATATLDGKSIRLGKIYVSDGEHHLRVSLNNFNPVERIINGDTNSVSIALKPSNAAGEKLFSGNEQYQLEREAVGSQEAEGRAQKSQTPLISLLPVTSLSGPYKIDYGQSKIRKGGSVIIVSDSSPNGRKNALKWIRSKGFDPAELEIEYADFQNPLLISEAPR